MAKSRAHVIMSGMLQGFFVRSAVKTKARLLKINGWIRNNTESELEAVFEGEKDELERMVEFLRMGPNRAVIYNFDLKWEDHTGEFQEFEIKPAADFQVTIDTKKGKTPKTN